MGLLDRLPGRDPIAPDVPPEIAPAMEAIARMVPRGEAWWEAKALKTKPPIAELVARPEAERAAALLQLAVVVEEGRRRPRRRIGLPPGVLASELMALLARRKLALSTEQVVTLLRLAVTTQGPDADTPATPLIEPILGPLEASSAGWSADERTALSPLLDAAAARSEPLQAARLRALMARDGDGLPPGVLDEDEPVGRAVVTHLAAVEGDEDGRGRTSADAAGAALRLFAAFPASGKPTAKWRRSAAGVAGELGDPVAFTAGLLASVLDADDAVAEQGWVYFTSERNEDVLRGAIRFAGVLQAPELVEPLARVARHCVGYIGGQFGSPRSLKLSTSAVAAIVDSAQPDALRELLALERTVKHGTVLKSVRTAIDALAEAQGVTRDDLLEQAVEDHGLGRDGTRTVRLSSRGSARIEVGPRAAGLVFVDEDGGAKKTFPADVKAADETTLAGLRDELKAIRKTLAGERLRLDRLLASDRSWAVDDWRRWYVDHPITGQIARDLIWRCRGGDGAGEEVVGRPTGGGVLLLDDGCTAPIPDGATVRLWHPVLATPTEVGAWRDHCLRQRVVQPVKQAFREIYVLTPAERESAVYSNRFAAHLFQQSQARALMKSRGWTAPALAWWDDGRDVGTATRALPAAGLTVQFWYDPITELQPDGSELWPLCSSDQVRFVAASGDDTPVPLEAVPPVTFSEALRDVDLFIGVTSIGADPEWLDRGGAEVEPRYADYWRSYGFGDLSAAAEIRRELLAEIVPSLAIADRLELEDRFLRVRGDLRTYRIHLGSGNIQMEPNAEYLCIVTARSGKASKVFLPLDDDPVLTLLLSKAFLLAADAQITDETIVRQIKRG